MNYSIIYFILYATEQRGMKRTREDDEDKNEEKDEKKASKEDKDKSLDPRDIKDPESVPDWSDESVQALCNNLFVLPEDNTSVTLNPCKYRIQVLVLIKEYLNFSR